ncbi:MAG: hypothetical protein EA412_01340 [Chitinophagaceae bacterium]|nr:MAG: hypothetical protein EA412_01340 [Chitinophagaceae bacterium]
MNLQNSFSCLILLFLIFTSVNAEEIQEESSKTVYYYFFENAEETFYVDTLAKESHFFDPVNKPGYFSLNTGNTGSPNLSLAEIPEQGFGFRYAPNLLGVWNRNPENLKVYKNTFPYTDLSLLFGGNEKVMARAIHSQPIGRGFQISGDFQRINSKGAYNRQRNLNNHLSTHLSYVSPLADHTIDFAFFLNNHRGQENGGLENINYLNENPGINKELVPILLNNAERNISQNSFLLQQKWRIGNTEIIQRDTVAMNDTIQNDTLLAVLPEPSNNIIFHKIEYKTSNHRFTDFNPNENAYPDNVNTTVDSIHRNAQVRIIDQRLGFRGRIFEQKNEDGNLPMLNYAIYQDFASINVQNLNSNAAFLQFSTGGSLNFLSRRFSSALEAEFIYSGYNSGDFQVTSESSYDINKNWIINAGYRYQQSEPYFIMQQNESSFFSYENDFEKTTVHSLHSGLQSKKSNFSVNASIQFFNNYTYFNDLYSPTQHDDMFLNLDLSVSHQLNLGRFHLKNYLLARYLSDKAPIDFPAFQLHHSLFFQNDLFNQALTFNLGLDIRHRESFFMQGYDIVNNIYYEQRNWKPSYHPVVDIFLNVKIQTVRVSLSLTHVNSDLFPQETDWGSYRYPITPRTFQLGIQWLFYN